VFKVLHIEDRGKTRGKFDALNTVLDMLNPYDLDYADFSGVPAVGSGTGFQYPRNFHHTDVPARGDATLVQENPYFCSAFCTVLDRDLNRLACHDHPVCLGLNFMEFIRGNMLKCRISIRELSLPFCAPAW